MIPRYCLVDVNNEVVCNHKVLCRLEIGVERKSLRRGEMLRSSVRSSVRRFGHEQLFSSVSLRTASRKAAQPAA